jgi:hypothetical protein
MSTADLVGAIEAGREDCLRDGFLPCQNYREEERERKNIETCSEKRQPNELAAHVGH